MKKRTGSTQSGACCYCWEGEPDQRRSTASLEPSTLQLVGTTLERNGDNASHANPGGSAASTHPEPPKARTLDTPRPNTNPPQAAPPRRSTTRSAPLPPNPSRILGFHRGAGTSGESGEPRLHLHEGRTAPRASLLPGRSRRPTISRGPQPQHRACTSSRSAVCETLAAGIGGAEGDKEEGAIPQIRRGE